jgi:glycosyltransferase involved in cell wall biosynthesis
MVKLNTKLSFIIPTFNEEKYIGLVLDSIYKYTPKMYRFEIITIDNGSTDKTVDICKGHDVNSYKNDQLNISGLRNLGVSKSDGDILIFIDADVILTKRWGENLTEAISIFSKNLYVITGSRCLPTDNEKWLNKHWFTRMTEYDAPYINSGHLITSRKLFRLIEGFSPNLETAEDYDFCEKARNNGAEIINNKLIAVIHLGYPNSIKDFFSRERWHGRQDFKTFDSFLQSKIAWVAAINVLLLVFSLTLAVAKTEIFYILTYPILIFTLSILLSLIKYKLTNPSSLFNTSVVFIIYIWGRTFSLLDRFFSPKLKN